MFYIDIHSHIQFAAYDNDRQDVIQRAREAGVGMINVGTQQDTSRTAVELAHKNPDIAWATIGLHPIHTSKSFHDHKELGEGGKEFTSRGEAFDYEYYRKLGQDPKVVGIGECGLDYYRLTDETKEKQHETFVRHIELANELQKPLMLHIRDAYDDALVILKQYAKVRGDCHFFAGDWTIAKQFLDLGFTLSFTGVITFADQYDEVVKNTPLDMILTETDSPYITPIPHRGKRNEPMHVPYIVKKIAELKQLPEEDVAQQILANARRVFHLQ